MVQCQRSLRLLGNKQPTLPATTLGNGSVAPTVNDPRGNGYPLLTLNEKHALILNFTLNSAAKDDHADARIEYYLLTIYSNNGLKLTCHISSAPVTLTTSTKETQDSALHLTTGLTSTGEVPTSMVPHFLEASCLATTV